MWGVNVYLTPQFFNKLKQQNYGCRTGHIVQIDDF